MSETQNLTLKLPKLPKDAYYEDYVASILNAGSYYLERAVHRTEDGIDLLELDVVATKYDAKTADNTIIEIKSGSWGIKDIFKVRGWLDYLDFKKSAFIHQNDNKDKSYDTIKEMASKLDVTLLSNSIGDDGKLNDTEVKAHFGISLDDIPASVIKSFRYYYDLERVSFEYVKSFYDENTGITTANQIYEYYRKLNDSSFFYYDPVNRLNFITDLSHQYKNFSALHDHELNGEGILDPETTTTFRDYFSVFFPKEDVHLTTLDSALHIELLCRINVVKCMVDYVLSPYYDPVTQLCNGLTRLHAATLQSNIYNNLESFRTRPYFYLYPYFLQVYFFVFGGFILLDMREEEYDLLSRITKLPKENINQVFEFWNKLFPTDTNWFRQVNELSNILEFKMTPITIRGIGVNFRLHLYADKEYEDPSEAFDHLNSIVTGVSTYRDLVKWNNAAYYMLKRDYNLHVHKGNQYKDRMQLKMDETEQYLKGLSKYKEIHSFTEYKDKLNKHDKPVDGFVALYPDDTYDWYIIKNNQKNESLPIANTIRSYPFDSNKLKNCYVIGINPNDPKAKDKVWQMSRVPDSELSEFSEIEKEVERLQQTKIYM